jgi:hypothetical protein
MLVAMNGTMCANGFGLVVGASLDLADCIFAKHLAGFTQGIVLSMMRLAEESDHLGYGKLFSGYSF